MSGNTGDNTKESANATVQEKQNDMIMKRHIVSFPSFG
jgi:hypothetical protein